MKKIEKLKFKQKLTASQMKNIRGGAGWVCAASNGRVFFTESYEVADAWCYAWEGFGYSCSCQHFSGPGSGVWV